MPEVSYKPEFNAFINMIYNDSIAELNGSELRNCLSTELTSSKINPIKKIVTLTSGNVAVICDASIEIWDVDQEELIATLKHSVNIEDVIEADQKLITIGSEPHVRVWNSKTATIEKTINTTAVPVSITALEPNRIAVGLNNYAISIFNTDSGAMEKQLSGHTGCVRSFVNLPSDKLASGAADKTIRIWEWKTGRLLKTITDHSAPVTSLVITPDGKSLISTCVSTLHYWAMNTLESDQCKPLKSHSLSHALSHVQTRADSTEIVGFGPDGISIFWYEKGKYNAGFLKKMKCHVGVLLKDGNTFLLPNTEGKLIKFPFRMSHSARERMKKALQLNSSLIKATPDYFFPVDMLKFLNNIIIRNVKLQEKRSHNAGYALVHYAAENGLLDVVKGLYEEGWVIDEKCSLGITARQYAAQAKQEEVVSFLKLHSLRELREDSKKTYVPKTSLNALRTHYDESLRNQRRVARESHDELKKLNEGLQQTNDRLTQEVCQLRQDHSSLYQLLMNCFPWMQFGESGNSFLKTTSQRLLAKMKWHYDQPAPQKMRVPHFKSRSVSGDDISQELRCPISNQIMHDPVLLSESGNTYERECIEAALQERKVDPLTNQEIINPQLMSNQVVLRLIQSFLKTHQDYRHSHEYYLPQEEIVGLKKAMINQNEIEVKQYLEKNYFIFAFYFAQNRTLLHLALEVGTLAIFKTILGLLLPSELDALRACEKPTDFYPVVLHELMFNSLKTQTPDRITQLHFALYWGANINARDEDYQTLLHVAVEKNDVEAIRYLLQNGSEVSARDAHNLSAVDYAAKSNPAILGMLSQVCPVMPISLQPEVMSMLLYRLVSGLSAQTLSKSLVARSNDRIPDVASISSSPVNNSHGLFSVSSSFDETDKSAGLQAANH